MIYIKNAENNRITTDNWSNDIHSRIDVYIDDIFIESYYNEASNNEYIVLTILGIDLIDIENKEYKLRLIDSNSKTLIKSELVVVKGMGIETPPITLINNKKDIFYE